MLFIIRWAFERLLMRDMPEAHRIALRAELEALLRKASDVKAHD